MNENLMQNSNEILTNNIQPTETSIQETNTIPIEQAPIVQTTIQVPVAESTPQQTQVTAPVDQKEEAEQDPDEIDDTTIEIGDDFKFDIDVKKVSEIEKSTSPEQQEQEEQKENMLGTEQSGNITF